jgi:hypothetical protein
MTFDYLLPGPQKASGPDDSNHRMVIASENTICRPLCRLFNLSLRKTCFPSFWKPANVTAVFKKSDNRSLRTIEQYRFSVVLVEYLRELSLNMF